MGLGLLANAISPRGLALRTPPLEHRGEHLAGRSGGAWSNGIAIYLDAREPQDYAAGHIGNAFNLPALNFEAHFGKVAPLLTPTSRIVVYCDGTQCDLSHRVSERLQQMGFTNVRFWPTAGPFGVKQGCLLKETQLSTPVNDALELAHSYRLWESPSCLPAFSKSSILRSSHLLWPTITCYPMS